LKSEQESSVRDWLHQFIAWNTELADPIKIP
jgi:hypothetical protein